MFFKYFIMHTIGIYETVRVARLVKLDKCFNLKDQQSKINPTMQTAHFSTVHYET